MRWSAAALRALPALALSAAAAAFTSPPLVSMSAARTAADERSAAVIAGHWRRDADIRKVQGALQRRHVDYSDGGCSLRGIAVWPALQAETRKLPGVLVVHTAVGLQEDFMDFVLSKVASMGCFAFGADMYGAGCALWDRDSIRMAGAHLREDRSKMVQRTLAAYEAMCSAPEVDPGTVASIGFCFGGIAVLDLARSGQAPHMADTFSVHGVLDSPNLPPDLGGICGAVSGRVTVFHGGSDPFTSSENLSAFESNMHRRNAEYQRVTFPGVMHAFTRPEKTLAADSAAGLQYDEAACEHTWDRIRAALSVMSGQTT